MKTLRNLMAMFFLAFAVFACQNETKEAEEKAGEATEQMEKKADEVKTDAVNALASFKYICGHCQKGSHEAGKCECGMDYKENADFVAEADHSGHSHDEVPEEEGEKKNM